MNVWLLKDGETLPIQPDARKMRTWMLADELVRRGHEVTWWASTHSHQRKTLLCDGERVLEVAPRFRLRLLDAGAYRENRSLRRLLHHARLAARFRSQAAGLPPPDVVVAAFPTIELAFEAVRYGRSHAIPVVVDIRDPWPDTIVEHAPVALRAAARVALIPLESRARESFAGCDSLVACSRGFLDWGLRMAGMDRRPLDRVFYLGNGGSNGLSAPTSAVAELARRIAGKTVFTFVGSFGHVYELRLVIDAARALARRGHDGVHFVLAGEGAQSGIVAHAAASFGNLSAPGWLSAPDADFLLSVSSVGLAPIRQQPGCVPNKIFEYAAAGLPILSSLEGETAEILARSGAGFTYPPGDVEAFVTQALRLCADEPLRREMARNAASLFEREFAAARIYGDYVGHVESVAHARTH